MTKALLVFLPAVAGRSVTTLGIILKYLGLPFRPKAQRINLHLFKALDCLYEAVFIAGINQSSKCKNYEYDPILHNFLYM
tara:strand:+ start:314 stop:553 length:240 start_codon:yes stop_codon:yes gene_type:complete